MNETLLTITLLLVCVCNLGVLYLYWRIERWMQTPNDILGLLMSIDKELKKFARETDYDFRALKTRERNQEKAFQKSRREVKA